VEVEGQNGGGEGGLPPAPSKRAAGGSSTRTANVSYSGGVGTAQPSALAAAAAGAPAGAMAEGGYAEEEAMPVVEQRRVDSDQQVGRNDPCWCGSGKKFKKCHGA
jgi:preprotein translocase subunit SecA